MNASRIFSPFLLVLALMCGGLFSGRAAASEILDNEKVIKMIEKGVSLKVIMDKIQKNPSDCHFKDDVDSTIAIQEACKTANWKPEEIDSFQTKVTELAQMGIKTLKNDVNLFLTAANNNDFSDDEQGYERLVHKLVLDGPAVVPLLLDNLTQDSEQKRVGVLIVLARIGDKSEEIVKQCILMLDDPKNPVRAQAAKTVSALSGPQTGAELITMLKRADKKNDGVILCLGYMHCEAAIETLVQVLKLSRDSEERLCAAFALGQLRAKTPSAISALLLGILDEKDEKLRVVCAHSAALVGIKDTPQYIIKAFNRFNRGKNEILLELEAFKNLHAANFLVDLLETSDDNEVRKIATKTLEVMTGEHFETKDQWKSYIDISLAPRPEWQEQKEPGKLPEPDQDK